MQRKAIDCLSEREALVLGAMWIEADFIRDEAGFGEGGEALE